MRSTEPTDVPPYFWTITAIVVSARDFLSLFNLQLIKIPNDKWFWLTFLMFYLKCRLSKLVLKTAAEKGEPELG